VIGAEPIQIVRAVPGIYIIPRSVLIRLVCFDSSLGRSANPAFTGSTPDTSTKLSTDLGDEREIWISFDLQDDRVGRDRSAGGA
jgi:hypothetical protein